MVSGAHLAVTFSSKACRSLSAHCCPSLCLFCSSTCRTGPGVSDIRSHHVYQRPMHCLESILPLSAQPLLQHVTFVLRKPVIAQALCLGQHRHLINSMR